MPRLTVTRIGAVVAAFGLGVRYIGDFLSMAQPSLPAVPLDVTASVLKPAVTKVIITEIMSSTGSPSVEDAIAAQHLLPTLLSNVMSHLHQPNIMDATHYTGIPLGFPYGSPGLNHFNVTDDMNYTGIPLSFPNATNSTFTVPLPSNNTRNDILNITALPSSASFQAVGWLRLVSATLNNFVVTLLQKSQEAYDTQHNAAIALLALFSLLVACLTPCSRHWVIKNKSLLASTALGMMSGHHWSLLSVLIACPNILVQLLHSLLAGTPVQVRLATKIIDITRDITVNIMRLIGQIVESFRAAALHWKLAVEYSDLTIELRKNNDTLGRENEDLKAELEKLNRKFDTLQRDNNPVAEDNEARTNKVEELDRMGGAFLEDNHALAEDDEVLKTKVGEVKRTGEATPKILEFSGIKAVNTSPRCFSQDAVVTPMPSVKSNAQQHLSPYAKAVERMSLHEKTVEILELKKGLHEVEKVGAELYQAKKDYDALNEKFRITSIELKTTSEELKEAHDDLLDVGADVIHLESDLKKTGEELAEARAKLNRSTADVKTSKKEHDQSKTDLQAAKKQLEDTTMDLKQANADLSKARTSLGASILTLKDERASTSKANKECQHVNDQLLQVIAEHKKLTAKCKELEDEAKQNEADFEESMGSAMAENADAKKEIKQLKSDAMEQNGELNDEITQLKSNVEWSFNEIYLWKSWTVYLYHVCFNMYGGPMFIHNILPLAVEGEPRPINLWGVMEPSQQMYVDLHGRLWDMQVEWLRPCNLTGGNLPAADMSNSTPLAQGSDGGSSGLPPAAGESIAPAPSYDAPTPQPAHTDVTSPPIKADGIGHDGNPSASTAIVPPTTPSLPHHGASSISPDPQLVSGVTPGHVPLHHSFADLLAQVSPGSPAFDNPVQANHITRSHKQVRFDDPVASFKSDRKPAAMAGQKSDTASKGGPPQPGVTGTTAAHVQPFSPSNHTPGPSLINQESVNAVTNKQRAGRSFSKPAVPERKIAKAARTGGRTPRARVPGLFDDAFDSLKLDDIKPFAETRPATEAPLQATPGPLHDTAPAQDLKAAAGDVPDTKDIEAGHTLLDILQVGENDDSSYAYSPLTSAAEPGVLPRPVPVLPPGVYDAEHDTPEQSPVLGPIHAPMTQNTSQNIPPQSDLSSTWGNPAYQDILMGDIEDNCGVSDDSSCPDAKEPATGTTSAADTLTQQPSAVQCPEDTAWSGEGVFSPKSPPPVSPVDAPTSKPADLPVIQPLNQPPNSFSITTEGVDNLIDIEFARVAAQIERGEEPRFGSDDDEGDCIMGGDDQNTSRPQTSDVPTTMDGVTGPTALAPVKTPTDFDSPLSGGDQTVDDVPASDPSLPAKGPTEMDTCPPDLPDNDDDLIEFFAKLDLSKQPSKPAPTAPTAPDGYAPAVPLLPFEPAPSRSDWANDRDFANIDIGDFIHVDDDDIDAIANDVNRSDHPLNDSTCGTGDGPQPAILDPPDPSRSPVTGNGPYWLQPPQPQIEPADQGSGSDGSGDIDPASLDKVPTPVSNYAAPKQDGPSDGSGGAPDIIPIDPAMLDPPKAAKGPVPSWFMDMIG